MENLCLKIMNKNMEALAVARGENEVNLVYTGEYQEGEIIILEVSEGSHYAWLQWDDAIGKSMVYLTGNVTYRIPFGDRRINLSPKAFAGKKHLLSVKLAKEFEIQYYRNLAVNVCDQHEIENIYPHATANVETRGEAVFAAQNAIDGYTVSSCHGEWPYQSWGINRQEDARIRIDFGREVLTDTIVVYLRTDFPHDGCRHAEKRRTSGDRHRAEEDQLAGNVRYEEIFGAVSFSGTDPDRSLRNRSSGQEGVAYV